IGKEAAQRAEEWLVGNQGQNPTPGGKANRLLRAVEPEIELWVTPDQITYATVISRGRVENLQINSIAFRRWLINRYCQTGKGLASGDTFEQVVKVLDARAAQTGAVHEPAVRVGEAAGNIYLDLCNDKGEVVEITPNGWSVTKDCPVKFIRPTCMEP